MNGEWNYDISWDLNDLIVSSDIVDFMPQDVERVIIDRTHPKDDDVHYWILDLGTHPSGRFVSLTGSKIYNSIMYEYNWLYIMNRHQHSFDDVVCRETPMFIQRDIPLKDGYYVDPTISIPMTVGQIIQDRKDKVIRLGHLRNAAGVLSRWVKLVQSEGYT